jgi:predicted phosphate transport protein (TIGR00153 family)
MLNLVFKKENQVEQLIFDYLKTLKACQDNFLKALQACLLNGSLCDNFEFYIKQTHKYESKADDINLEINSLMYGNALIPESRGDILGLMEAIDAIPDLFEKILYNIQMQRLTVPEMLIPEIEELVRISLESCDLMARQVEALFRKTEGIRTLMQTIDTNESHCDHIERKIITKVFDDPHIDPVEKLQIKELIQLIGKISDRADHVSRRINILSLKRRV